MWWCSSLSVLSLRDLLHHEIQLSLSLAQPQFQLLDDSLLLLESGLDDTLSSSNSGGEVLDGVSNLLVNLFDLGHGLCMVPEMVFS